jgi:hypothetical protein
MSLSAPPEAIYPDPNTAFTAIQLHAKQHGYAFFRFSSKPSRIVFACDRAGKYDSRGKDPHTDESKQRKKTGSKKCGCLMKVAIRLDYMSSQWMLQVLEDTHNHGPSAAITAHPAHRITALTPDTRTEITRLSRAGLSPGQILTLVESHPYLRSLLVQHLLPLISLISLISL